MLKKTQIFLVLFTMLIVGSFVFYQKKNFVLTVGEYNLTSTELNYRSQVNRIYYPDYQGNIEASSLEQMRKAFTKALIMKKYGMEITDELLVNEKERIQASTRDPKMLEKIQKIFGSDDLGYLKVFVLPTLVDRAIYYNLFLNNSEIHLENKKKAQIYLEAVLTGKVKFGDALNTITPRQESAQVSEKLGFEFKNDHSKTTQLQEQDAKIPANIKKHLDETRIKKIASDYTYWSDLLVKNPTVDSLIPTVIEFDSYFMVGKIKTLNNKNGKIDSAIDLLVFDKQDFGAWLQEQETLVKTEGN